jgi:membrane protease YdiL (CAAX protease family)
MSFTLRFTIALAIAIAAAMVLSPFAALAVHSAGFHIPFPRIFDRTVMATLLVAMLFESKRLKLWGRLRRGFEDIRANLTRAIRGFAVALGALGILFALASATGAHMASGTGELARLPKDIASAIAIAIIEEGFFRAFLLDGLCDDFSRTGSLAISAAIYALAHVVRSPARFYVAGFAPMAGVRDVGAGLAGVGSHGSAGAVAGLFLLGLVLGEAFLVTGTVYFSLGLHAGLVLALKSWPQIIADRASLPRWLFGEGRFPLVSGVAAWAIAIGILFLVRPLSRLPQDHAT